MNKKCSGTHESAARDLLGSGVGYVIRTTATRTRTAHVTRNSLELRRRMIESHERYNIFPRVPARIPARRPNGGVSVRGQPVAAAPRENESRLEDVGEERRGTGGNEVDGGRRNVKGKVAPRGRR